MIVDGYNIINNWPDLVKLKDESFDHSRDHLLDILSNYRALMGNKVIVVFDAHQVKGGSEKRETIAGVDVIYSKEGETADMVIERIVSNLPKHSLVSVATSDRIEQQITLGKGAARLPARELLLRVLQMEKNSSRYKSTGVNTRSTLDGYMTDAVKEQLEKLRRRK